MKNGSLTVTFFSARMLLPDSPFEHPIHQQERVAMRQPLQDLLDIHLHGVIHRRCPVPCRPLRESLRALQRADRSAT